MCTTFCIVKWITCTSVYSILKFLKFSFIREVVAPINSFFEHVLITEKKTLSSLLYIDLVCTFGLKGFLLSPGAQYWLASCKTNKKKKTRNHHKLFNVVLSHTHTLHNQRRFIVFSLFYQAILELCWNHGIFSLLHYLHITLKRKNILTMRTLSNNQTWIMRAKK